MKITKDTVVSLQFKIAEPTGKLIEESKEPMVYLHGGYENTLPKIEEALDGQEPGYQVVLDLGPEDAFGLRDESLVQVIPKTQFPPGVKVGGQLEGRGEDGSAVAFTVMNRCARRAFARVLDVDEHGAAVGRAVAPVTRSRPGRPGSGGSRRA
jgi:FKBP-type peptidyl-prolyl cis-trans isomerase SlyD